MKIQRVLLPTDFSETARQAKTMAQVISERFDAELHLLHVLETHLTTMPQFVMGLAPPTRMEESKQAALDALENELDPSWKASHRVVLATAKDAPFVAIVQYARENDIDLIVIGTHGHSGIIHNLIGSVAERVVRKAPCPVLTIRPESHAFVMP